MGTLISGFQEAMMPRGPKGEKHPADVIGNAVHVMRVAFQVRIARPRHSFGGGTIAVTRRHDRPANLPASL